MADVSNAAASTPQSLLRALVGAIDPGVVRQLARLPDAGVEGLARVAGAVVTLVPVGLKQVTSVVCQRHGAIVRAERRGANQPFILQMFEGSSGVLRVVSEVLEIGFGNDAERADRR